MERQTLAIVCSLCSSFFYFFFHTDSLVELWEPRMEELLEGKCVVFIFILPEAPIENALLII